MPTSWSVGPVIAYLFTDEPVTLIDAGLASSRPVIEEALNAAGLSPADVARILVTHGHGDHLGGALWLQEASGCDVCLHPTEIAMVTRAPADVIRELFGPLGFAERMLDEYARRPLRRLPQLTPIEDGTVARTGGCRLRVEHHPGHTPGHLWLSEEDSGALFAGDYLLASGPTNPGMVTDAAAPSGRAPLLAQYVAGLTELARRAPPVIFAGHGEPITAVRELVQRRVARIERRGRRVLAALRRADEPTAAELAEELYRGRARASFDVIAELVGHLDLLVSEGHASARLGEDGYWHFRAIEGGPHA